MSQNSQQSEGKATFYFISAHDEDNGQIGRLWLLLLMSLGQDFEVRIRGR